MCELCKKIIDAKSEYLNALSTGNDFIFEDDEEYWLRIDTGDSGCPGVMKINYCPICGRELDTDDVSTENKKKFVQIMRQLTAKRKG